MRSVFVFSATLLLSLSSSNTAVGAFQSPHRGGRSPGSCRSTLLLRSAAEPQEESNADEPSLSSNNSNNSNDNDETSSSRAAAATQKQSLPERKRLDPLLVSVTRNNDPNYESTPKTNLPLLGEVTMDRSLFLVVPAALFTVLGLGASFIVLLQSTDAIVDAVAESGAMVQSTTTTTTTTNAVEEGCRGLCSTQEQDLEGLRTFMQGLAGK